MSLDIFVQGFHHGNACDADAGAVHAALRPFLVQHEHGWNLRAASSAAEIYGVENLASGFMVTRVEGEEIFDVLVQVASDCDLVIMPVGIPTLITRQEQLAHLPDALRDGAVFVTSGAQLRALIENT